MPTMYQAAVPPFVHMLENLGRLLDKAEKFAEAKKIDPAVLVNARLAPDMFPLARQVQIASDAVKAAVARLTGKEVPSYPDTETTFSELQERIKKTIAFINSIKAEEIDGTEGRTVTFKVAGQDMSFQGTEYLAEWVKPNFYFHVSIAYAILRHNGVELGKRDFLGK